MSLIQLFKQYRLPSEIQMLIQQFNIEKKEYDTVITEIQLQYNSGLWWLYKPQVTELLTTPEGTIEEVDKPTKVEFMTYDDGQDICEQAILLEELHNELYFDPHSALTVGTGE
tara:strand:- start:69 stop:407 length:339 start_codon:yes stop_codon:yes gene_type:complete